MIRASIRPLLPALVVFCVAACAGTPAEKDATPAPAKPAVTEAEQRELDLAAAQRAFDRDPRDEMAAVWLGRRLGYVGRYEDAVEVFTRGIEANPKSAWLLRFRGHRYITLRRFDDAVRDLTRAHDLAASRADEVEPDGAPNKAGVPIGTLHSNIDYHLGLAFFLKGDYMGAWRVYEAGFPLARQNDDRLVSHTYWAWLTLRKLNRAEDATRILEPIRADMAIHENQSYLALLRLFRGDITEAELLAAPSTGNNDAATRGFGAGMKRLFERDTSGARVRFERVVKDGPQAAFGCIAAETELKRMPTDFRR
jgi:tetratricopeptide (TPR) repeat protein